jgi:hypothetical protein
VPRDQDHRGDGRGGDDVVRERAVVEEQQGREREPRQSADVVEPAPVQHHAREPRAHEHESVDGLRDEQRARERQRRQSDAEVDQLAAGSSEVREQSDQERFRTEQRDR